MNTDPFEGLLHGAQSEFGEERVYISSLLEFRHVGLPLQCLALEYLFGSDKLILGKSYGIAGPSESFKSSMLLDFMRHICSFRGSGMLVETEGEKISVPLLKSTCGAMAERILLSPVDSVNDAQRKLTWMIEYMKEKTPERNALFILGLDSIGGAATEERGEKIRKEGSASRDYSSEALLWTSWLRTYASKLAGWPIVLIYVNHEKDKIDSQGHGQQKTKAGGKAQDFYATVYLSTRRVKEAKGSTKTLTQLRLRTEKNSFGEHRRAIDTVFVYDHSGPVANMHFDWDESTCAMLAEHKPQIKELVEVTPSTDNLCAMTRTYNCRQFGLKSAPASDVVAGIMADEELLGALRVRLGINHYNEWDGVMPIPQFTPDEPVCENNEEAETVDDGLEK